MSGILALFNLDGTPIEKPLLQQLTNQMSYRGASTQALWTQGCIGLGQVLIQTTDIDPPTTQPLTLDRQYWIVADARIDDLASLRNKLGVKSDLVMTDTELILQAYGAWGETCVHHLIGDYAFVIWDNRQQRLFCACDQLGVRFLYYVRCGSCVIVSNAINSLRGHPLVSSRLHDQAIADFLVLGYNSNPETTTFAEIQRLPAAHTLVVTPERLTTQCYWTLPQPSRLIRYRQDQDYIDHFQELFTQSVSDRLRTAHIAVMMSGGLDSTAIAATALDIAKQRNQTLDLQAFTVVYDELMPDQERYYAGLAAQQLQIPIHYRAADHYSLFDGWPSKQFACPEPLNDPLHLIPVDQYQAIAQQSRVVLYGQGGDEVFSPSRVGELATQMSLRHLIGDCLKSILYHHQIPDWGTGLWAKLRRSPSQNSLSNPPPWLNPTWEKQLNLGDRWHLLQSHSEPEPDMIRANAYKRLTQTVWRSVFEDIDPGQHGFPVETYLPFLDLRLIDYLLAVPPLPWFTRKYLLRKAMQGKLPSAILQRPKAPLPQDPVRLKFSPSTLPISMIKTAPGLADYVDIEAFLAFLEHYREPSDRFHPSMHSNQVLQACNVFIFAFWLLQRF